MKSKQTVYPIYKKLTLLLIFFLNHSIITLAQDEKCIDVLRLAAFDILHLNSRNSSSSELRNWICSDKFISDIQNKNTKGTLIIPEYLYLDFNQDYKKSMQERQKFCSSSFSSFSNSQEMSIYQQILNETAIKQWGKCMEDKRNADRVIKLQGERSGSIVTVTAKFNIVHNSLRNSHPIITKIFPVGMTPIDGDWKIGTEVPVAGIAHQFKILNSEEEASIILSTTEGISNKFTIEPIEYPENIGYISVDWEYPLKEAEKSDFEILSISKVTGDHECFSNCQGEPTRTNYTLSLTAKINLHEGGTRNLRSDEGYFKDPVLECVAGGGYCSFSQIKEVKLLNATTAFASWDVWSGPTRWRLSATWVDYVTTWKNKTSRKQMNRGDRIQFNVPKNARTIKFTGVALRKAFEYSPSTLKNSTWFEFVGETQTIYDRVFTFIVRETPIK